VRIAYLQDERQLARVSPEELGIVRPEQRLPHTLQVGNPRKKVASENVSHFRREWLHRYRVTLRWANFVALSSAAYATIIQTNKAMSGGGAQFKHITVCVDLEKL